jgi:hypothetical protein
MTTPTASAVLPPALGGAITSARAIPMDTAVAATAVESASAAVVINSTTATDLYLGVQGCRPSCSSRLIEFDFFDM